MPDPATRLDAARTILVADDDDKIRDLLRAMIERGPHRVVETIDGAVALRAIERSGPDLVVLDLNMPDFDGPEVCRRLKGNAATRGLPVLMLTAATDPDDNDEHGAESETQHGSDFGTRGARN